MTPQTFLTLHTPAILVEIAGTKGSVPRETDAFMLVARDAIFGTIGGGQLEYLAIDHARHLLGADGAATLDIPLGPEIGQCCGGRVELTFSRADSDVRARLDGKLRDERDARPEVWLFGAGHVGKALAQALVLLPVSITVIETREAELAGLPDPVKPRLAAMPEALVAQARPGAAIVILTHDHALDFLIARAALARVDLAYVGMIGSKTKRATFTHWALEESLTQECIARLILPIGGTAVRDKRPEVIAAMVAAELLVVFSKGRIS